MRKNRELALKTLEHIAANLGEWNQNSYHTCFAGHALRLSGYTLKEVNPDITVAYDTYGKIVENPLGEAAAELGFTAVEACDVFLYFPEREVPKEIAFKELSRLVHIALGNDNDTDFPK